MKVKMEYRMDMDEMGCGIKVEWIEQDEDGGHTTIVERIGGARGSESAQIVFDYMQFIEYWRHEGIQE